MTFIPISALGTVTKGFIKGLEDLEIRGQVETILTTALLRLVRILRRVLETWSHSNSSETPSVNTSVINLNSSGRRSNNNTTTTDDDDDDDATAAAVLFILTQHHNYHCERNKRNTRKFLRTITLDNFSKSNLPWNNGWLLYGVSFL